MFKLFRQDRILYFTRIIAIAIFIMLALMNLNNYKNFNEIFRLKLNIYEKY